MNFLSTLLIKITALSLLFTFSNSSIANTEKATADINAGKALYQTCISCHGDKAQGNDALKSPSLAGQYDWYLATQLNNFKSGKRGTHADDVSGQQMAAMAKVLANEQAVNNVSAYLASLPSQVEAIAIEGDARNGDNKYNAVCGACHGPTANGNESLKAPNLTILSSQYLTTQVNNYKAGIRGYHADDKLGRQMKMMAGMVRSEKDLIDIIAFIKSKQSDK
ncbi:c-type cytochrome [Thalassomonas sp. M1454]|uniref:c-type cytochrome n=1 Tax=Thalassomonas sp. M1454 TaxID=2594477 RepID=UPI00117D9F89|nr:c-type cytochrome [Thalassomonas sp. M1454]TRX55719.1 c-type cytochrome [Thalassomonas sp. M1454]